MPDGVDPLMHPMQPPMLDTRSHSACGQAHFFQLKERDQAVLPACPAGDWMIPHLLMGRFRPGWRRFRPINGHEGRVDREDAPGAR